MFYPQGAIDPLISSRDTTSLVDSQSTAAIGDELPSPSPVPSTASRPKPAVELAMSVFAPPNGRYGRERTFASRPRNGKDGGVEMWRGGCRWNLSVAASFVWRCLNSSIMAPFPHPAHRTGHAARPHPALGQDLTPSPTARRAQAGSAGRDRSARTGAGVESSRPCVV